MRVAARGDQDFGDPRRGISVCGECNSYELPPSSSEYSATALETSLPYASTAPSPASRSSHADVIGRTDRAEITGRDVRKEPAANAGAATVTRTSINRVTQLPPAPRVATAVPRFSLCPAGSASMAHLLHRSDSWT